MEAHFLGLFCHCLLNMSLLFFKNLTSLCMLFVNNWARIKFPASVCSQIDKVKQSKESFFLQTSVWELSPAADWSWQNERPTRRWIWIWSLLSMWAARWRQQDDELQISVPRLLSASFVPIATFWHPPLPFFHLYLFFLLPFALLRTTVWMSCVGKSFDMILHLFVSRHTAYGPSEIAKIIALSVEIAVLE